MPVFLTGASGILIRDELGVSISAFGLAVSLFFGTSALAAIGGGKLAERIGPGRALVVAVAGSSLGLTGLALMPSKAWFLGVLSLAGIAQGIAQPASHLVVASGTPGRLLAFRFGIKQASIPISTLLAGLSIPLIATTFGWRWGFGIAAGLALTLMIVLATGGRSTVPERALPPAPIRGGRTSTGPLIALAIAAGIGSSATTSIPSFLSHTADAAGLGAEYAGWILAIGSVAGIISRLVAGWSFGSSGRRALGAVGVMLLLGAVGYSLLGMATGTTLAVGTIVAYAFGSGWPGLFHFAVVVLNPDNPGVPSGIGQTGASAGAALGPLAFGLVASAQSYELAWTIAAAAALTAGLIVLGVRGFLRPVPIPTP